jgi:hypothetical protein
VFGGGTLATPLWLKFDICFTLLDFASDIAVTLCAGIGCGTSCCLA